MHRWEVGFRKRFSEANPAGERCGKAFVSKPSRVQYKLGFPISRRAFLPQRRLRGRPGTAAGLRRLIEQMASANPLWRAPRIHGELKMLGIAISRNGTD
jgi:hypothetical protein